MMENNELIDIYAKIATSYGLEDRLCMLMEECGELIQAANKVRRRYDRATMTVDVTKIEHMIEEIADVRCLIFEVMALLGINESEVELYQEIKTRRVLNLISRNEKTDLTRQEINYVNHDIEACELTDSVNKQ